MISDNFRRQERLTAAKPRILSRLNAWLAVGWLAVLFFVGGSARADVPYLVVLRPLSVILLGVAVWQLDREGWRRVSQPAVLLIAFLLLALLHLLPLPPAIWRGLPNMALIRDIYDAAGWGEAWRPLSIAPNQTWNAAMSVFPVLALVLLLASKRLSQWTLAKVVLALGLSSVILGLLQMASGSSGSLYFYRYYNGGLPIGYFANRNHQAAFLAALIPLAASFALRDVRAAGNRFRIAMWGGVIAIFLLAIAVLGSRAGLGVAAIAVAWSLAMVWRLGVPVKLPSGRRKWLALAAFVVIAGGLFAYGVTNAVSLDRARGTDFDNELRVALLEPVGKLTADVMPLGTGVGTFVEAYRSIEPDDLLQPNYINHAHNDWLEWVLTGGLPLVVIVLVAMYLYVRATLRVWRAKALSDSVLCAHWAAAALLIFAIASLFDYPLRTPALAGLAGLAAVWLNRFEISRETDERADGISEVD